MNTRRWLLALIIPFLAGCSLLVVPLPFESPTASAGIAEDPAAGDPVNDALADPGLTISPLTVSPTEGGADASYSVVLDAAPTAEVVVTPSAGSEVTLGPTELTFTVDTWDTPQSVTVAAVDDSDTEGNHAETVTHSVTSTDPDYDGLAVADVTVSIVDNDAPGVSLTATSLSVDEAGPTSGSYDVVLTVAPSADVTVAISAGTQVAVTPTSLTFTTADWDTPQTVSVTAVDDLVFEAAHSDTVSSAVTSADTDYDGISVADVSVSISDDEVPLKIYALSGTQLFRYDDMAGSNAITYDGAAGTAFTNSINDLFVDNTHIYLADQNGDRVYRFEDMIGANQTEYAGITDPYGVSVYAGQIYTTALSGPLYRYDDMAGTGQVTYDGNAGNAFTQSNDVTVTANGIYLLAFDRKRLYRFDDMTGLNQEEYDAGGAFVNPRNVAVDSLGRIYVTDLTNGLLYRFDDMTGTNLVTYDGGAGTPFGNPAGLAIDSFDRIYVSDNSTNLIYRFDDMTGTNQVELPLTGVSEVFVFVP